MGLWQLGCDFVSGETVKYVSVCVQENVAVHFKSTFVCEVQFLFSSDLEV